MALPSAPARAARRAALSATTPRAARRLPFAAGFPLLSLTQTPLLRRLVSPSTAIVSVGEDTNRGKHQEYVPQRVDRVPHRIDRDLQRMDPDPQRVNRDLLRMEHDLQRIERDPCGVDSVL